VPVARLSISLSVCLSVCLWCRILFRCICQVAPHLMLPLSKSLYTIVLFLFSGEAECCSHVAGHVRWKQDNLQHKHNQFHTDLHVPLWSLRTNCLRFFPGFFCSFLYILWTDLFCLLYATLICNVNSKTAWAVSLVYPIVSKINKIKIITQKIESESEKSRLKVS